MNRTIKGAKVKRSHNEAHDHSRRHLDDFLSVCNYARRLKTLSGLTPDERIGKCRTWEPESSTSIHAIRCRD